MIAKNNIFNIRKGSKWLGTTGEKKGFVEFDNREHAMRAWLMLMRTYRRKYGCKTIRQIVTRYAPPSENDTSGYIRYCCKIALHEADAELLFDMDYCLLGVAMAKMETGVCLDIRELYETKKKYDIGIVKD